MIPPVPYHLVKVFAWSCQPSLRPCSTLRMVLSYSQQSAAANNVRKYQSTGLTLPACR